MRGEPYRTPLQGKKKPYAFRRKRVEAQVLANFSTVLNHLVHHPDIAPRLKLKGAENAG